ncbi:hypothetical protein [Actinomadura alba]|uniref:Uncharacterized protein n=1 Tax=Actinomadura alba TaxID=406431 RepID=A0ABR7LR88_9ACTN|nr:hypothetical protein [Actinomadura alba]MBC6467356.1 hypothetical protein [Actinomadura alba]
MVLLGLIRGASWSWLAELIRSMPADGCPGPAVPPELGGIPAGDLFAVANAVSMLLDAPVTIEDRRSRVMAFSGRQLKADEGRIETVDGPDERFAAMLHLRLHVP